MKCIDNYISEKLHLKGGMGGYMHSPNDKYELAQLIGERIAQNGVKKFNGDLNDIDVSNIEDFTSLIVLINKSAIKINTKLDKPHIMKRIFCNVDISKWDVSNMKNAQGMFMDCKNFNCDLSNWNVKNLENGNAMFAGCENLDFDISKWNPEKININKTWRMIVNTKLEKQDWMR